MAKAPKTPNEPGTRNYVVKNPNGTYVMIYAAGRRTETVVNEATRFSLEAAKEYIRQQTAEWYDTRTGMAYVDPHDKMEHIRGNPFADTRPSTRHIIERVETTVVEQVKE